MLLDNLRLERSESVCRVGATVRWEESDRPPQEIFYEVDSRRSEGLSAEPNALLIGCYLPAMRAGERRIRLAGPVCPQLRDGLAVAGQLLRQWYGGPRPDLAVETDLGFHAPVPRSPARAAFFFTGGIDSMAMLFANRRDFPPSHPAAFREAVTVFGLNLPGQERSPAALDLRDRTIAALETVLEGTGIEVVAVNTNLATLAPDIAFLELEFLSAALVSAAQLFPSRWSSVSIASGRDVANLFPQGTHPLLDPAFGTAGLTVRHEGLSLFRLGKLLTIAPIDRAIENLIVCMNPVPPPFLNCGVCEKCVRTMTELVAVGRLSAARWFPDREVTAAMIEALPRDAGFKRAWAEMLPELRRRNREDLVGAIERKLEETRAVTRWFADQGMRGRLRRLDRKVFGGRFLGASRAMRRAARRAGARVAGSMRTLGRILPGARVAPGAPPSETFR